MRVLVSLLAAGHFCGCVIAVVPDSRAQLTGLRTRARQVLESAGLLEARPVEGQVSQDLEPGVVAVVAADGTMLRESEDTHVKHASSLVRREMKEQRLAGEPHFVSHSLTNEPSGHGASLLANPADTQLFDCNVGFSEWLVGWSVAKKEWCCRYANRGCPATTDLSDINKTNVEEPCTTWACHEAKIANLSGELNTQWSYHPINLTNVGTMFDCQVGLTNYAIAWSTIKKEFCCFHYRVACGTKPTRHARIADTATRSEDLYDIASGEEVCNGHNFSQTACRWLGCCNYDAKVQLCYSAVGSGLCTDHPDAYGGGNFGGSDFAKGEYGGLGNVKGEHGGSTFGGPDASGPSPIFPYGEKTGQDLCEQNMYSNYMCTSLRCCYWDTSVNMCFSAVGDLPCKVVWQPPAIPMVAIPIPAPSPLGSTNAGAESTAPMPPDTYYRHAPSPMFPQQPGANSWHDSYWGNTGNTEPVQQPTGNAHPSGVRQGQPARAQYQSPPFQTNVQTSQGQTESMRTGLCYGAPCQEWASKRSCSVLWQDECPGMNPPDGLPATVTLAIACPQECSAQAAFLCGGAPCSEWVSRRACTVAWKDECPGTAPPNNYPDTITLFEACPQECDGGSTAEPASTPKHQRTDWETQYWGHPASAMQPGLADQQPPYYSQLSQPAQGFYAAPQPAALTAEELYSQPPQQEPVAADWYNPYWGPPQNQNVAAPSLDEWGSAPVAPASPWSAPAPAPQSSW